MNNKDEILYSMDMIEISLFYLEQDLLFLKNSIGIDGLQNRIREIRRDALEIIAHSKAILYNVGE